MAVIGKDELTRLIERYKCIHPFNPMLLDGDGYILTVRDDVTLNYLEHKNVISYEVVFTPPNYVAHLTAKSRYGRLGLSFLNAAKVHSGFVGRIVLEVVNLNNERKPITIRQGEPFMHIEFIERIGKPSPYEGEYQFQYMSDDEVSIYLSVLKEFGSAFNLERLERIAARRVMHADE
ncbi:dCTP deaminase [archaeon HR04]|nr:dCTP deaminase [archaeon HR04]